MEVVGYTCALNEKKRFSSVGKQATAIRKLCAGEGFSLNKIFHDDQDGRESGLAPQFCNMLNDMLLKNMRTIVVDSWDAIPVSKSTFESLIIFLLSKGVEVVTCRTSSQALQAIIGQPPHRERVKIQKEFSRFDLNFENVKRIQARKEIRLSQGKCEGRKSYVEVAPDTIKEIRRLRRKRLGRKSRTYREIAKILNATGYLTVSGKKFTGNNVSVIFHRLKTT